MSFTAEQIRQLLQPIKPERVLRDNNGMSHVSQQDVTAHLSRIFGFTNWDKTIIDLRCVRDSTAVNSKNKEVPAVTYICTLRLTVRCPEGCCTVLKEDVGTGTSPNLPSYGDAHDFAAKNAVSYALKRCAKDLGDQFGLSLYNKGQMSALVKGTLVTPGAPATSGDVQEGVEQQVSDGEHTPQEPEQAASSNPPAVQAAPQNRTAKQEVWADAQGRGWSATKLAEEFLAWSKAGDEGAAGVQLKDATDAQLRQFLGDLRGSEAA